MARSSTSDADALSDVDRHIEWLQKALRRREQRLLVEQAELQATKAELQSVYASTSWRITAPLRQFSSRRPRLASRLVWVLRLLYWTVTLRLPERVRSRRRQRHEATAVARTRREHTYERWIALYDTLSADDTEAMRRLAEELESKPIVSILLPVFNAPERFLCEAIDSVRAQTYSEWELCIADDASTLSHVRRVLDRYAESDERITVAYRDSNGGISAATNTALELATGQLIALLDHDDVLRPHALLLAVRAFSSDDRIVFVYSDEDQIDEEGRRFGHNFKPEWDPTLLLSQNYVCHFSVFRSDHLRATGGFRTEYDGSQDWDLALRLTSTLRADEIAHVPHVLYHWRAIPGSAALSIDEKPYALDAARRATIDHLGRSGRRAYITPVGSHQCVRYAIASPPPRVSAIVPSTGDPDILDGCIRTLLEHTDYPNLDIVVAVSAEARSRPEVERYLDALDSRRVTVAVYEGQKFNYSRVVNWVAARAGGDQLLLLNDDTRGTADDWLEAMVGHVAQPGVAAAGAMLLYGDDSIQHAGMLLGGGHAHHLYKGRPAGISGYVNRARLPRGVSAVTAACMLVRRHAFDQVGGMDERLPGAYNDVDFCLKVRRAGWRVTFVPDALLYHCESASFGSLSTGREAEFEEERRLVRQRWGSELEADPFHNPNLALDASYPSRLAFPPRVSYPWRQLEHDQLPHRESAPPRRSAA